MKSLLRTLPVCALAVCLAGFTLAEDKKPVEKKDDKKPVVNHAPFNFPKSITLSDDQQKKLDELKTEYQPKLTELTKKIDAITNTPDRKKAREEAAKKAKEDGKKGKELQAAINEANKYTDDEKKEIKNLGAARGKLVGEINKKKNALLTEEQLKSLQPKPKDKAPAKDKPTTEKDKAPAKDKKTEK